MESHIDTKRIFEAATVGDKGKNAFDYALFPVIGKVEIMFEDTRGEDR
ncbi:hypothetical protein [Desulforhopalus sp. IMCC35007]|nr:hypothetical protein [Desulforhopalus sp. IMCC35007]